MKKRLIGTLLLGALMVSSSSVFVSCSDYDDDVKDLQTQINSLSSLLTQKETTINGSITNLQSALTALENASKAGDDATLTAAKQAVEDAKKALEDAIKANYDNQVAKNAELDAAILKAQTAADQALKQLESKADVTTVENLQNALREAEEKLEAEINTKASQAEVDALAAQQEQLKKDLEAAKAELEAEIAKKANQTDLEALQAQVASLKTALDEAKAELQAAIDKKADQATVDALQKKVDDAEAALKAKDVELAAAIEANTKALEALQKKVDDLKAALEAKDAELQAAIDKKADQAEVDALKQKIEDYKKALEEKDVELANQIIEAKTQIGEVAASLAKLEEKVGTLSEELTEAVKNISALEIALEGQKKALEEAKAELEDAISDNADAIAANGKSIEENKAAIAANLQKINALDATIKALDTELKTLIQTEINKVNQALSELDAKKVDLVDFNTLKAAHETYVEENDKAVAALQQKAAKAEQDINALGIEIAAVDTKYNTITAALAKSLRSLVYMPTLYVDGIESIEYPYLIDTLITKFTIDPQKRKRTTPYAFFNDEGQKNVQGLSDYHVPATISQEYFGPTWPVDYHLNPTTANPSWADVKGWNRRNAIEITRSTAGDNGAIQVAEYFADGKTKVFGVNNGIVTVGLKVTQPQNLANHAIVTEGVGRPGTYTEERVNVAYRGASWIEDGITYKNTGKLQYDDIIALQLKAKDFDDDPQKIITSDYAMIYPEAVWPEAIIWTKYHSKLGYSLVNFDEKCPYLSASANKIHVWDTPQEALGITDPTIYPDIELYYNDKAGIDLADLLGIHYIKDTKIHSAKPGTLKFKDADFMRFGLTYKFELIDYSIDGNSTHDSKYCTLSEDGIIIAKNVKADGVTIDDQSATSVGREPLVRVLVSRGDRTILDGYILVHITEKAPEPEDLLVDNYPAQDYTWDLCGDKTVFTTNWSQFSYYVLTEKMDNLEKDNFDLLYGNSYNASGDLLNGVPDLLYPAVKDVDYFAIDEKTYRYDNVMVFNDNNGKPGSQCKTRDLPGQVRYFHNFDGTTNHRFEWVITGNELEEYTHDNGGKYLTTPRTITKWFRYTRTTGQAAKYEHVYVKMTLNLKRATIANVPVKEKIDNYWFNYQGSDTGWDAIIWNPWFPQDFGTIHEYVQYIPTTFRYNKVNFQNTTVPYKDDATDATRNSKAKYYFTPYEFQIQAQDGTWYTITARSGKNDQKWDAFVCKYLRWENDGTPSYNHIKKDGTYHNLHWYSASNDKTYTEHKWAYTLKKEKNVDGIECERWYTNADANKNTHKWCAIYTGKFNGVGDPELDALGIGGGVYDNKTLYAVQSAKGNIHGGSYATATNYTPIAELNQNITSGEMKLVWRTPDNDITKEVLNAVGYFKQEGTMDDPDFVAHWNVKEELNSMVGIIAHNGCYVALDIDEEVDGNDNTKAGTFYTSWQRPINVVEKDKEFYDATTNGEYHLAVDFIKIFDWRGPVKGYMWDDAQWLWAYNNIKSVIIDTYPGRVYTNMHQTNVNTFVPLNSITTEARLYTVYNVQADGVTPATSKHDAKYARTTSNVFDAANYINIPVLTGGTTDWPLKGFDEQAKNDDLLREMGLKPVNEVKKLQFLGGIYYENNGDNVTDFDVKVPVWINYEWGRFCTNVMIHIHRSLGN